MWLPEFCSGAPSRSRSDSALLPCFRCLWRERGAPISKDKLMEARWPGLAVEESNLAVQIAALRRTFA